MYLMESSGSFKAKGFDGIRFSRFYLNASAE